MNKRFPSVPARKVALLLVLPLIAILALIAQPRAEAQGNGGLETLPAWGQVPSPNSGYDPLNWLEDVEVISPTDIWAAGSWGGLNYPNDHNPMLQHWDGAQWSTADLPDSIPYVEMYGIDSSASDNVWAVGHYGTNLVLRYDGTEWTQVTIPTNGYNWVSPTDVMVLSPTDVWVTGELQINYTQQFVMLYHWDGTTWTDHSIAYAYGQVSEITAGEAISPDNIWIVGHGGGANNNLTFVYHYDGTIWQNITNPVIAQFRFIEEVATLPSGEVWLVGTNLSSQRQVAYFNGTTWSLLPTPPNTDNFRRNMDIEAVSTNDVWVTGLGEVYGSGYVLVWHWDGTAWTVIQTPTVGSSPKFNAVDAKDGALWVVGHRFRAGTLIERWNGTNFEVVASENGGAGPNELNDIDGLSDNEFWTVGDAGGQAIAFHQNNGVWEIENTPPLSNSVSLEGVAQESTSLVWAVGSTLVDNSLNYQTVIFRWNGTEWARVPSPNPAGEYGDELHDVITISPTDAWAVGGTGNTSDNALILHWDGSAWSNVPNSCGYELFGISALAPNDIWAVGSGTTCHYDGTTWTRVALTGPLASSYLEGVDGVASNDVWAVGALVTCDGQACYSRSIAARWNGSSWVEAQVPGRGLSDVVTLAPDNAYAVGTKSIGTVLTHWNGSVWEDVPVPDPETGGALQGMFDASPGKLWAVGYYYTQDYQTKTLVVNAPSDTQGSVFGNIGYGGATVVWSGPVTGSTTSDPTGDYMAAGLPAGTYNFLAIGDGCPIQQSTVYITAGLHVRQDFDLCGTQPTQVPSPTATTPGATPTATQTSPTMTPSPTPMPGEPTATATVEPNEPTATATVGPNEPTATATVGPNEPTATATVGPNEPTATATVEPNDPTATPTVEPNDPTATATVGPNEPTATPTTMPVVFEPASVNGAQEEGQTEGYRVEMTNMGATPLVWSSYTATTSCSTPAPLAWVSISPPAGTTAPGATTDLMVSVSTDGMSPGMYHGYVCILDSAGMIRPLSVNVRVMAENATILYLPMVQRQ